MWGPRARRRRWIVLVPTLVLALWAAWWVTSKTRERTFELPVDSSVYLSTSESLRGGGPPTVAFNLAWDGYTPAQAFGFHGRVPATHFPPGYPAALAVTSFVAGSVRGAARALDVVLVAVNVLLVGWLTARMTAFRSVVVATLPAALVLFASDVRPTHLDIAGRWLTLHRSVASEPLFTALFMVGLLALSVALTGAPSRAKRALIVAVGASTAALFVRYIGAAFVLTAVLALVALDRQHNLGARLRRAGMFAGVAVAPTVVFIGWAAIHGAASPRPIFFHPVVSSVRLPFEMFARYLFPPGGPYALRLLATVVVIVLVVTGAVWGRALVGEPSPDDHAASLLVQLGVLSVATYVVLVIVTRTLFDVTTPINSRMLAPILGVWYAVVVAVAYRALVRVAPRVGAVAIIGALATVVVAGGWSQQRLVLHPRPARPPTRNSFDDAIARVPSAALIVSNRPDSLYDLTGRGSVALPTRLEWNSGTPNLDSERELRQLARLLDIRGGYLAMLPSSFPVWALFYPVATPPELRRSLELHLVAQSPPGVSTARLYQIVPRASPP